MSFDYNFKLNLDDTLYCSEFCSRVLNNALIEGLNFKPTKFELNNKLLESILNRKIIEYFPVDFFEMNKGFEKIYEWKSPK